MEVSFESIDDFLAFLDPEEQILVNVLRRTVLDTIPNCIEKLSYNVPYYKVNRNICFIWPASILWGKKRTYEGVRFGFAYGHLLRDEINYLDRGNRKQVYWKDFTNVGDIDIDLLKSYIFQAVSIDER
jgi:hypothetical protein